MQTYHTRRRADAPVTLEQPLRDPLVPPVVAAAGPGAAPPVPISPPPSSSPTLDAHGYDPEAYDWVPVPRRRRIDGWSPEKQRLFIGALADTGSVRTAAQRSGMSVQSAYRLRRSPEGKAFAAAWDAAIQQAAYALVDAAFERAVNGSEEPVWNKEGRVIGRRFRQSDAMMMFLLRKHFPDRYGDNHRDRAGPALAATAPLPPPVDETLARLGPVPPADPAATVDPELLSYDLARADKGHVPEDARTAAEEEREDQADEGGLGPEFEALLEAAKAEGHRLMTGEFLTDHEDDDPL